MFIDCHRLFSIRPSCGVPNDVNNLIIFPTLCHSSLKIQTHVSPHLLPHFIPIVDVFVVLLKFMKRDNFFNTFYPFHFFHMFVSPLEKSCPRKAIEQNQIGKRKVSRANLVFTRKPAFFPPLTCVIFLSDFPTHYSTLSVVWNWMRLCRDEFVAPWRWIRRGKGVVRKLLPILEIAAWKIN